MDTMYFVIEEVGLIIKFLSNIGSAVDASKQIEINFPKKTSSNYLNETLQSFL